MRTITMLLALCLLLASGWHVSALDRNLIREYQSSRAEEHNMPGGVSLVGIGVRQNSSSAQVLHKTGSHLLIFVVHHDNISRDIEFWNQVVHGIVEANPGAKTDYWGICDDGAACNAGGISANFPLVGYLDPYEMRLVALADSQGEALLYDVRNDRVLIPETQRAQDVTNSVLQRIK